MTNWLKAWYFKTFLPFEDPDHPLWCPDHSSDAAKKDAWIEGYIDSSLLAEEEATYEEAEAAYEEFLANDKKAKEFDWF